MIPKDLLKKIHQIEITTNRLVTDIFAGQYHSIFKGQGLEFSEVREYLPGDEIRSIDWNVTARTGKPHVKKYIEERELTVMILIDLSSSSRFGSSELLKSQLAAQVSAVFAFSAIRNNDKVGLIMFTDKIEKFIAPRKGRRHVLRLIREILFYEPVGTKTDLVNALNYFRKVTDRRCICFIVSDFLFQHDRETLRKNLNITHKRHDVIAVTLNDPREIELPNCGLIALEDAETKERTFVDSSDRQFRENYLKYNQNRLKQREDLFNSVGLDSINLFTDRAYKETLIKFFLKRQRHK